MDTLGLLQDASPPHPPGPPLVTRRRHRSGRVKRDPGTPRTALSSQDPAGQAFASLVQIVEEIDRDCEDLDSLYVHLAGSLPAAWRYPAACGSCLVVEGRHYRSRNYRTPRWTMESEIRGCGEPLGTIQVSYFEDCPAQGPSPFLETEHELLRLTARCLGVVIERARATEQLQKTRGNLREREIALEQANVTLRTILGRIEEERHKVEQSIRANVNKVLSPMLRALQADLPACQRPRVDAIGDCLEEITSPFADRISTRFAQLTPLEIRICRMLRDEMSTKQIASVRQVSQATVARQREGIRRKLGLTGTNANLSSFLRSLPLDEKDVVPEA